MTSDKNGKKALFITQ